MLTQIRTATLAGVTAYPVTVEIDLHRGLPGFTVVGLAGTTIKEACSRIKPAILNSGYEFPNEKMVVNLVPAGRPKEGSHFDLPIALGIVLMGCSSVHLKHTAFMGELSLDGSVNRVNGALPLAMGMRKAGIQNIVLPLGNAEEVSILQDVNLLPVTRLTDAVDCALDRNKAKAYREAKVGKAVRRTQDFSQVMGQESAKRAIVAGAAGNHGILLIGGPGCGKTMMAGRIPTILPELTYEEKLEITGIYSVAGLLTEEEPVVSTRPFRSPHHTISAVGLIGGGRRPRPGELSLAHRGVLFLDELGEFDMKTIDAMRQPVEEGYIRISRNMEEIVFPSQVMIVAAANPCPCGNLWDEKRICSCSSRQLDSYRRKLMGPFSDRIDMHIRMNPVPEAELTAVLQGGQGLSSAEMKEQVRRARQVQRMRYEGTEYHDNGHLDQSGIGRFCPLDQSGRQILSSAYEKFGLTMRACHKILKIARTLADLEQQEEIKSYHIAEALAYRTSWQERAKGC